MASEFSRVWISKDGKDLAWEVTGDHPGVFTLGSEATYADESEILNLDTEWNELFPRA